jgi:hypothetical protein
MLTNKLQWVKIHQYNSSGSRARFDPIFKSRQMWRLLKTSQEDSKQIKKSSQHTKFPKISKLPPHVNTNQLKWDNKLRIK